MTPDALIAQMRAQRQSWVDLAGGIKVRVLRPAMGDVPRLFGGGQYRELATECVDGWEGVTEATLLGAGVGGASVVEWSRELWQAVIADRPDWWQPIVEHVIDRVNAHTAASEAVAKN